MPLTNQVIILLNEITANVQNKKSLSPQDEIFIKDTFGKMLNFGQRYDVDEIESWFDNEGSWTHKPTIIRITNMSHYVQSRFEQAPKKLRLISDSDGCGCD
jgi:hypothetical protein